MYCDQNHTTSPKLCNSKHKALLTCNDTHTTTLIGSMVNQNDALRKPPENFETVPDICEFIPELTNI